MIFSAYCFSVSLPLRRRTCVRRQRRTLQSENIPRSQRRVQLVTLDTRDLELSSSGLQPCCVCITKTNAPRWLAAEVALLTAQLRKLSAAAHAL